MSTTDNTCPPPKVGHSFTHPKLRYTWVVKTSGPKQITLHAKYAPAGSYRPITIPTDEWPRHAGADFVHVSSGSLDDILAGKTSSK